MINNNDNVYLNITQICMPPPILPMCFDDGYFRVPELPIMYDAAGLFAIPPSIVGFHDDNSDDGGNVGSSENSRNNNNNNNNNNNDNKNIAKVGGGGGGGDSRRMFDDDYRSTFASAFISPLTSLQQQKILSNARFDIETLADLGLTPEKLPLLVEMNEKVAMECLLQIAEDSDSHPFLTALVNSDLSLHSLEVVNRLINANKLPYQFINEYISHSFAFSNSIKNKSLQNRLVR